MTISQQFANTFVSLLNVTVSGNSEGGGGAGGVFLDEGRLDVRHTTIANNSRIGLGARCCSGEVTINVLRATLITGNGDKNCSGVGFASEVSAENLDSGSSCEFNPATSTNSLSNVDPKIGPLQNNGGPTPTHALLLGSPAVDAAGCILVTDQRGVTRPLDGNLDGQLACDVGAFERPATVQGFILPPLGVAAVSPANGTASPSQAYPLSFLWDVPAPRNWGALGSLDLRLVSGGQVAFWLRWDQLLDTFQLLDASGNPFGFAVPGGLDASLTSGLVTLDTANTKSAGSGITGQRTTLSIPLLFSDAAIGRVFQIEVSGRDDEGRPEPFVAAGVIAVAAPAAAAVVPSYVNSANNGDEPKDSPSRLTEEQRQQRARTNKGGHDDEHTEGQAIASRCDLSPPEVDVASHDGTVTLLLRGDAKAVCTSVTPGAYLEADGEKVHEQRYWIDSLDLHTR
jgi:hypothetical protein